MDMVCVKVQYYIYLVPHFVSVEVVYHFSVNSRKLFTQLTRVPSFPRSILILRIMYFSSTAILATAVAFASTVASKKPIFILAGDSTTHNPDGTFFFLSLLFFYPSSLLRSQTLTQHRLGRRFPQLDLEIHLFWFQLRRERRISHALPKQLLHANNPQSDLPV